MIRRRVPSLLWWIGWIGWIALGRAAVAQEGDPGIAAERLIPAPGPSALLSVEGAGIPAPEEVSATIAFGYAARPITLVNRFTGQVVSRPVAALGTLDAGAEVGVSRRVALGIGLGATLFQSGDRLAGLGLGDERPLAAPRLGDLRLRAKLLLAGGSVGLRAALVAMVTVPTGGEHDFAGTSGTTFEPRLALDFVARWFTVAAHVGVRFAPERALFGTRFGDELDWGAGASGGFDRARLVGEVVGAVGTDVHPIEVRGALRFLLGRGLAVDAGAGAGLVPDAGAPAWRIFVILRR